MPIDCTFSGCSSLISIAIPSSVTSIGGWTFEDCISLQTVTFGANSQLKSIGWDAFIGCSLLESVYYGGTAEKWAEIDIASGDDSLSSATIYYYSEELTEEQKADGNNYWHYVNGVPTVWTKEII